MDLQLETVSPSASSVVVSDTGRRVYRASFTLIVAGVGIIGFFFVLGSIFGRQAGGVVVASIAVCFACVLGFVGWLIYKGARLTLAPEGVTYQTLGYTLSVPWDGILGAGTAAYAGGTMEALALRQEAVTVQRSRHFGLGMPPVTTSITLGHDWVGQEGEAAPASAGYIIPVALLSGWEHGDIQREMKRYAPHLFA